MTPVLLLTCLLHSQFEANIEFRPAKEEAAKMVSIELDKTEFYVGENILLHYHLRNISDKAISYSTGWDHRNNAGRALRFKVEAKDDQGNEAADPCFHIMSMGGIGGYRTLEPGEEYWYGIGLLKYRELPPSDWTISVFHDLGWEPSPFPYNEFTQSIKIPEKPQFAPVVKIKLTIKEPTEEIAKQIIKETLALPTESYTEGRKASFQDFSLLCHPVYLPWIVDLAKSGDARVMTAFDRMAFPEATEALLGLAVDTNPEISSRAITCIAKRVILPDWPPDITKYFEKFWTDELKKRAIELSLQLISDKPRESSAYATRILIGFSRREHAPQLIDLINRTFKKYQHDNSEQNAYLRGQSVCSELIRAAERIAATGFSPELAPESPGEAVFYLLAFRYQASFRPPDYWKIVDELANHEIAVVRELALACAPGSRHESPPGFFVETVSERIFDQSDAVRAAACKYACRSNKPDWQQDLAGLLNSTRNEWLISDAYDAAIACGYPRDKLMTLCAERLTELQSDDVIRELYDQLTNVIDLGSSSSNAINWRKSAPKLRNAWMRFIDRNRDDINAGKEFLLDAPEITTDLVPEGMELKAHDRDIYLPARKTSPIHELIHSKQ